MIGGFDFSGMLLVLFVVALIVYAMIAAITWRDARRPSGTGTARVKSIRQTSPGEWTADVDYQPPAPERRRGEG